MKGTSEATIVGVERSNNPSQVMKRIPHEGEMEWSTAECGHIEETKPYFMALWSKELNDLITEQFTLESEHTL